VSSEYPAKESTVYIYMYIHVAREREFDESVYKKDKEEKKIKRRHQQCKLDIWKEESQNILLLCG
jgi:hypothetical protein